MENFEWDIDYDRYIQFDTIEEIVDFVRKMENCTDDFCLTNGTTCVNAKSILGIIAVGIVSDGTLWEVLTALYFRWTCLPDCAVPELDADYRRNNRRLS